MRWTSEQIISHVEFDEGGVKSATPEVQAYIERTFGMTVEEFFEAAVTWFLANPHRIPNDN